MLPQAEIGDGSVEGNESTPGLNFTDLVARTAGPVVDDDFAANPESIADMVAHLEGDTVFFRVVQVDQNRPGNGN